MSMLSRLHNLSSITIHEKFKSIKLELDWAQIWQKVFGKFALCYYKNWKRAIEVLINRMFSVQLVKKKSDELEKKSILCEAFHFSHGIFARTGKITWRWFWSFRLCNRGKYVCTVHDTYIVSFSSPIHTVLSCSGYSLHCYVTMLLLFAFILYRDSLL